ncbi:MAG: VCBS repeat-containing protein [Flavobacteriales bacterium]|nr:VCBS repeat-containing protein [Flavobacteriales bacterium]
MQYQPNKFKFRFVLFSLPLLTFYACSGSPEENVEDTVTEEKTEMYFETVSAEHSGINFKNTITETDTFNYLNFQYMYNGGGVAVGDINNDGLSDLYFTGNQVADKLYLNNGNMQFEDISDKALDGQTAEGWHTGVTMADVNQDGYLDIYVSRSGLETFNENRTNLLYINNQDNTFSEKSEEYGLNVISSTNQSAFFDMDNDGDLDLYIMNRPYPAAFSRYPNRSNYPYSDILMENVDGKFVDISRNAGIQNDAYGLGIAITDLNDDGFQDIYIANDYVAPDLLYINNGDGTFSEELQERIGHIPNFSMGNDAADFNNDGLIDIMTVDMISEDHIIAKKTMGGMNPDIFWKAVKDGNHYQYMFNALQINNGNGTFSDVGQLAGVSKTDWSWAPLFADFDNDGLKDLFVTNGYRRDLRDTDYNRYIESISYDETDFEDILSLTESSKIENYCFKNMGDLKFKKVIEEWKLDQPINSNGAAYADLDNDGDLDLIVNNMEDASFVMENKLKSTNQYLRIECDKRFEGAKVTVKAGGETYYQEMYTTRGYQSSVEPYLHFGLGKVSEVDELTVVFNDGNGIHRTNVKTNQTLKLKYADAKPLNLPATKQALLFTEAENVINHRHEEIEVDDFAFETLLPHKMSQLGPFISKGDANGDGLEDLYVSGSRDYSGKLFIQNLSGQFIPKSGPWSKETAREEMGSLFIDIENDGDLDLYVVSGSNEVTYNSDKLLDQLYINDGKGNFTNESTQRLPPLVTSGQSVSSGDYDGDGDLDLFVGGRQIPGYYPFAPRSILLRNDGGFFKEATINSSDLLGPGLVTSSLFDDFDRDGDLDLICVGEWMPISFFENTDGVFKNVTAQYNLDQTVGWWMSIEKGDFNGDGVNDYVIGNIGENNKFHPSNDHPLEIYVDDFDQNGTYDIVLGEHQNGTCFPVRGRSCSSEQMPFIANKFPTYNEFAQADLKEIYGQTALDSALHISATNFSSSILLSSDSGFVLQRLPSYAQMGPLNGTVISDFDGDGNLDIVAAGNNFSAEIETIRYDGGRGSVLLGDGKGSFKALSPQESGFFVNTDVKALIQIRDMIVVSSNQEKLKVFKKI